MNQEYLKGNWDEFKGKLKQQWADLTDDDLLKIKGKSEEIYGILEQRCGMSKEAVEDALKKL